MYVSDVFHLMLQKEVASPTQKTKRREEWTAPLHIWLSMQKRSNPWALEKCHAALRVRKKHNQPSLQWRDFHLHYLTILCRPSNTVIVTRCNNSPQTQVSKILSARVSTQAVVTGVSFIDKSPAWASWRKTFGHQAGTHSNRLSTSQGREQRTSRMCR